MKEILDKINQDIADCISGKFKFNLTDPTYIPQETDANFNSTYGMAKQGASMISCTLVVNIRNLTEIINANSTKVAGKIYTAFIKAIHHICGIYQAELNTAQLDKILILFATRNSFRNAVECAVTINTITKKLFDKAFNLQGLKLDIGIGAAYGSLICFKANSSHDEPDELHTGYSKVIWTGEPISAAQKLSQIAAFT